MVVRQDRALRWAIKTRSSMDIIRGKPLRNAGNCRICCGNRAYCLGRSVDPLAVILCRNVRRARATRSCELMKSVSGTAKRQLALGPLTGSLPNLAMAAEHYLAYRFHREPVADGIAAGLLLAFFRNGTSAFGGVMASLSRTVVMGGSLAVSKEHQLVSAACACPTRTRRLPSA